MEEIEVDEGFGTLDEYSKLKIFRYLDSKSLLNCFEVCKE